MAIDTTLLTGLGEANSYEVISSALGISITAVAIIFVVIGIWSLIWKGLSLWKSANKKSIPWFVILLIFNTAGILDILYIFVFSKISFKKKAKEKKK